MLTRGEIGARELTEDVLARMDAAEPQVGAYLLETRETALAQADAVDAKIAAKEEIPFLAGIPGVVKDNICMQGMRTTAASKILETFVPPYDATVVTKLRDADAVVLGKANMDGASRAMDSSHTPPPLTKSALSRVTSRMPRIC